MDPEVRTRAMAEGVGNEGTQESCTRRSPLFTALLNLAHAYDHFFMMIFPTVALVLDKEWAASYGEILALGTAGYVTFSAGTLPSGWLGDRWSKVKMMILFFIGIGISAIFTGLAQSPFQLAVGLGFIGLFASIYHPVGTALVVQGGNNVGKALGLNGVFGNLGLALAGVTTGTLAAFSGWRSTFIIPGSVAVLTGIAFWLHAHPSIGLHSDRAVAADVDVQSHTANPKRLSLNISEVRVVQSRIRNVILVLVVGAACGGIVFNALTAVIPKVFEERLGDTQDVASIGALVTVIFAAAAFGQLLTGYLLDRFSFKLIYVSVFAALIPIMIIANSAQGLFVPLLCFPMTLLLFGATPFSDFLVGHMVSKIWQARVYALKATLALGVSAAAVPVVAFMHDYTGSFDWLFLVLAVLISFVAISGAILLPGKNEMPLMSSHVGVKS